jgi:hypothetical protein
VSVARGIGRTIAVVLGTIAVGGAGELAYIVMLCPQAHLARRAARGEPVVFDTGYRFALPDERIAACTAPHRVGPYVVHQDFACYCVPPDVGVAVLEQALGGQCTIDKERPTRLDDRGICRHGHCEELDVRLRVRIHEFPRTGVFR